LDTSAVSREAGRRLAAHMVPAQLIVLDALPLTPAGKLDRAALPAPDFVADTEFVPPATDAERTLAGIVAGLLGAERVGATDSFFTLGGDSIMSIQLASAAKSAGFALTPRDIFENKTIRAMAAAAGVVGAAVEPLAELPDGPSGQMVITPIVDWMLEHADSPADFTDFSQANLLHLPAGLTGDDLRHMV
ncbi:hypothetical protein G3I15_38275, partial [Streptomyces sp. SID10244]|nr:hypothetical protein [Streptomyces sp. SID10244]